MDFRNFCTVIFRKEWWNKSLLKFSPHIKSVATLPSETWNVGELLTPLIYRTLCAGALSCWNMKLSPDISLMHGNSLLLLQQYFTIIVAVHFHFRLHNFIFQQAVHLRTGHVTQSHQWPRNSPDMYPFDYKIWAVMQQQVYEKRVNNVDELCQRLLSVWHSIGQNVIDEAIDQWRARLTVCVRAKGGHFEHLM